MTENCNGWRNRETWLHHMEISENENKRLWVYLVIIEAYGTAEPGESLTKGWQVCFDVEKRLENNFRNNVQNLFSKESLHTALIYNAIDNTDFQAIAKYWIAESIYNDRLRGYDETDEFFVELLAK